MKRTYSEMNQTEKITTKKELKVSKPSYLNCEVCSQRVYNYEECNTPFTYCSYDCYSILFLSMKNDYIDAKLPKTKCFDDLMMIDNEEK